MGIPYWQALLDTSNWGMANMQWNLGWEKMNFYSNLDTGFVNASGAYNWILDPNIAIWQAYQGNINNWGIGSNTSIFPWQNIGNGWNMNPITNPWNNPWTTPGASNSGGGNGSRTETSTQEDIRKINNVFKKIKEIAKKKENFVNPDLIVAFEEAAKTTKKETDENGKERTVTKTDEERLADMKEALKAFGDRRLRVALVEGEYNDKLKKNGFDFKNSNSSLKQNSDKDIDEDLNKLYNNIAQSKYEELGTIASNKVMNSNNVLNYISKWNETHNSDSERSILRFVATKFPTGTQDGAAGFQSIIRNLTSHLIDKAASEYESYSEIKDAKKALEEAQGALDREYGREGHTNASLKAKVSAVADKFEALYAKVRMQEAAAIDKDIKDAYGDVLNSIIPNTIPDKFIENETKADLESEGIKNISTPEEVQEEDWSGNTGEGIEEADVATLVSSGTIIETDKSKNGVYGNLKVYKSKGKDEKGHPQFFVVKDGKLQKLNGYLDGKKQLHDAEGNVICSDITIDLTEEHYTEATKNDILTEDMKAKKEAETRAARTAAAEAEEAGSVAAASIDYSSASATDDDSMDTAATEKGLISTKLKGYYMKKVNGKTEYYVYSSGEFTKMKDVVAINENGTAKLKSGKTIPLRELGTSASSAGACLREKLAGDTTESRYTDARVALNALSTYTDSDEIRDFFQGYENEKSWLCQVNSKMAAQIVTENGFSDEEKKQYVKTIAKKAIVLAKKAGMGDRDETVRELKEIAEKADIELSCDSNWYRNLWHGSNWTDFFKGCAVGGPIGGIIRASMNAYHGNDLVHTAKILDCLVEKVVEEYNKKNEIVEEPQQENTESAA